MLHYYIYVMIFIYFSDVYQSTFTKGTLLYDRLLRCHFRNPRFPDWPQNLM